MRNKKRNIKFIAATMAMLTLLFTLTVSFTSCGGREIASISFNNSTYYPVYLYEGEAVEHSRLDKEVTIVNPYGENVTVSGTSSTVNEEDKEIQNFKYLLTDQHYDVGQGIFGNTYGNWEVTKVKKTYPIKVKEDGDNYVLTYCIINMRDIDANTEKDMLLSAGYDGIIAYTSEQLIENHLQEVTMTLSKSSVTINYK